MHRPFVKVLLGTRPYLVFLVHLKLFCQQKNWEYRNGSQEGYIIAMNSMLADHKAELLLAQNRDSSLEKRILS